MKKNKSKAKRGMTLIEVIISVALLSILLIPISGLVMSSFKNNKKSEYKQKASYIGQNVLEELKAYDEIILKKEENGKEYFQLLDEDKIYKDSNENSFIGKFKRTIYGIASETKSSNEEVYNVEINMIQDLNFKYSDMNNLNKNDNADLKLDFTNDGVNKIKKNSTESTKIDGDLVIELEKNLNELILKILKKNSSNLIMEELKTNYNSGSIILYIEKTYSNNTNIEIKNNTGDHIDIYLIKQNNGIGKLNLISSNGNVILYEEDEIETNPVGDMYNYTVTVTDAKNNILFEGSSSKNIKIK